MKKKFTKVISTVLALLMLLTSMPLTALAATTSDGMYFYNVIYTDGDTKYIELRSYNGSENSVVVPSEIDGCKVVGLGGTFDGKSNIRSIVLPEGIDYIEWYTFRKCSSVSITLPSTLKYIGAQSFYNAKISSINFPEGLEAIDYNAFGNAQFSDTSINLPESLKYIGESIFEGSNITDVHMGSQVRLASFSEYKYGVDIVGFEREVSDTRNPFNCKYLTGIEVDSSNPYLKSIDNVLYTKDMKGLISYPSGGEKNISAFSIPEGVEEFAEYALPENTYISELTLSSTIKAIENKAFYGANIGQLNFGENSNIKTIGTSAFENALSGDLVIPASVEEIGKSAFSGCNITSLSFETPSSLKLIEQRAFYSCPILTEIFIPNSVTDIETEAFSNNKQLKTVVFEDNSKLKLWNNLFLSCPNLSEIDTGKNNQVETLYWFYSAYSSKLETLDFSNCPNLTTLKSSPFSGANSLKYINFSGTKITTIPSKCFNSCTNLETVILSDYTDKIESEAFAYCKSLSQINTDNLITIGDNAFVGCSSLAEIPTSLRLKHYNDLCYYETKNNIIITDYEGEDENLVIPDYINNKPVTKIADKAFFNAKFKTISSLPENLTYIGKNAFYYCDNLDCEIVIPDSVTVIDESAFAFCTNLKNVKLGAGLTDIKDKAFYKTALENIVIPDSIKNIGEEAFARTNLKNISFGKSALNLEDVFIYFATSEDYPEVVDNLFEEIKGNIPSLVSITVSEDNPYYSSENGVLFNKDKTKIIAYPAAKPGDTYKIPDTVLEISEYCFSNGSAVKEIILPENLQIISIKAFIFNKSLEKIFIPNSVNSIGEKAFSECSGLKYVEFEDSIDLGDLVYTFLKCTSLEEMIIPKTAHIKYLNHTFQETGMKKMDLIAKIDSTLYTFCEAALEEINLSDDIEEIERGFFYKSKLKRIVIPKSVVKIDQWAFGYCDELTYVNLSNVKAIGACCFAYCTSLESINLTGVLYVENTSPNSNAFRGCPNLKKLYFTQEEMEDYIAKNEFQGMESIETIVVGNSITSIEDGAFADCTNLETALIAQSVTSIADTAFDNCDNLSIVCMKDSYAQSYAERKSIPYTTFAVSPIDDQKYTGYEIKPELNVSAQGKDLSENTDYTAVFEDNINVGTAKVNVLGLGDYSIFASLVRFNIIPNENIPQTDEKDKPDTNGGAETDNGKDNTADNKSDSTQNKNESNANSTPTQSKQENAENSTGSNTQGGIKNDTASSVGKTNQGVSNQNSNNSVVGNSASADSENTETAENEKAQGGEQTEADGEEKTADEPATESDTDSNQDDEKKLTFWQKLLNMILNFFTKLIDIIKNLFA